MLFGRELPVHTGSIVSWDVSHPMQLGPQQSVVLLPEQAWAKNKKSHTAVDPIAPFLSHTRTFSSLHSHYHALGEHSLCIGLGFFLCRCFSQLPRQSSKSHGIEFGFAAWFDGDDASSKGIAVEMVMTTTMMVLPSKSIAPPRLREILLLV